MLEEQKNELIEAVKDGEYDLVLRQLERYPELLSVKDERGYNLSDLFFEEVFGHGIVEEDEQFCLFLLEQGIWPQHRHDGDFFYQASPLFILYDLEVQNIFDYMLKQKGKNLVNERCVTMLSSEDDSLEQEFRDKSVRWHQLANPTLLHYAVFRRDLSTVEQLCQLEQVDVNATADLITDIGGPGSVTYLDINGLGDYVVDWNEAWSEKNGPDEAETIGTVLYMREFFYTVSRIRDVTPLHLATLLGSEDIVDTLLRYGAEPNPQDKMSKTPGYYAREGASTLVRHLFKRLACQTRGFTSGGWYLDERRVQIFYDINEAQRKEYSRLIAVESRFFDQTRNRNPNTQQYTNAIAHSRRTGSRRNVIQFRRNTSARSFITADAAVVAQALHESGLNDIGSNDIRSLGWYSRVSNYNGRTEYAWPTLQIEGIEVSYQYTPSPGHLGGIFMFHREAGKLRGKGGRYADILKLFEFIIEGDSLKETCLARHILTFGRTGSPPSKADVRQLQVRISTEEYQNFVRFCFLILFKEPARRMFPGKQDGEKRWVDVEYPFASTLARALEMVSDGHLKFKDVIAQDAQYGPFTHTQVTTSEEGREKLRVKIDRINLLYNEKYVQTDLGVNRLVQHGYFAIPTREHVHQELLSCYGGSEDSDGEEYLSDDELITSTEDAVVDMDSSSSSTSTNTSHPFPTNPPPAKRIRNSVSIANPNTLFGHSDSSSNMDCSSHLEEGSQQFSPASG